MTRWSLKEACLLDLFGELPPSAREKLLEKMEQNPHLQREYEILRDGLTVLHRLPPHEPSAEDRRKIPAQIKKNLRAALRERQRQERAVRPHLLIRGAALAAACALTLFITFAVVGPRFKALSRAWPGSSALAPAGNSPRASDSAALEAQDQGGYGMPLAYADGHPWGNLPLDDYFASQSPDSASDSAPASPRNSRDYRQDPY